MRVQLLRFAVLFANRSSRPQDITINSLSKPAQGNNKIRGRNGIFLYGLVAAAGSAVSYGVYSMRKN